MPKRRPQDVVHTVMTDHLIRRTPGGPELLAPRAEREPLITNVETGDELYRAIALARTTNSAAATGRLEEVMARVKPAELEPYLDLAAAQLRQRRWAALEVTAKKILAREPRQELAVEWLALARAAITGNTDDAIRVLATLTRPEAAFNTGVLLAEGGRTSEAIAHYERALAQRPNFAAVWHRLGQARRECGDTLGAIDAFRRVLELDPSHAKARAAIVEAFRASGNEEEAQRYLNVATGR